MSNMGHVAAVNTSLAIEKLLDEQIETNRLLRKLVGEGERTYSASHRPGMFQKGVVQADETESRQAGTV